MSNRQSALPMVFVTPDVEELQTATPLVNGLPPGQLKLNWYPAGASKTATGWTVPSAGTAAASKTITYWSLALLFHPVMVKQRSPLAPATAALDASSAVLLLVALATDPPLEPAPPPVTRERTAEAIL